MEHIEAIKKGIESTASFNEIVRKVYLSYPSSVLSKDKDREFEICNEISKHFNIPIMSIKIAGSAQLGRSIHKRRDFLPKESDLDIAIIDPSLFQKYVELVFEITKGYSNRSKFRIVDGQSKSGEYLDYILKGIFRPDIMPYCRQRAEWNMFFSNLSKKNDDLFKSINAAVYMSQTFFESKQRSIISKYKEVQGI